MQGLTRAYLVTNIKPHEIEAFSHEMTVSINALLEEAGSNTLPRHDRGVERRASDSEVDRHTRLIVGYSLVSSTVAASRCQSSTNASAASRFSTTS